MDNVNLIIAKNLKNIRIGKGWSQAFVANQLGIAQRTISRAECGCGISKRTLKMLCGFYQVTVASVYEECVQEIPRGAQVVPDDVTVRLLIRNSFIQDLEQEVLVRYMDIARKDALMMRTDVENVIAEVLGKKKSYNILDIVNCCMVVNQKTIQNMGKLVFM